VPYWSLLEEAFGDRIATGTLAVGDHNVLRQSSPDWDETQEDENTPATAPRAPAASTSPSGSATPVTVADNDHDTDDNVEASVRTGRNLLRGKRSATGKTPAPKRAKREPASSQHNSALDNIAQQLLTANSQRETEFQERRPSWKRALELIQDQYKTQWVRLAPGVQGNLHLALAMSPASTNTQGSSNVTYADIILTIGSDKGRDKYVYKVIKSAIELQGDESEESEVEWSLVACQ